MISFNECRLKWCKTDVALLVVFQTTVAKLLHDSYQLWWFYATLFHCADVLFTWKTHCGLKFHFGQIDRSEIYTEVSFTSPEFMWTLIMSYLPPKWNFTRKRNLKPVWVHFESHVNVLLLNRILLLTIKSSWVK